LVPLRAYYNVWYYKVLEVNNSTPLSFFCFRLRPIHQLREVLAPRCHGAGVILVEAGSGHQDHVLTRFQRNKRNAFNANYFPENPIFVRVSEFDPFLNSAVDKLLAGRLKYYRYLKQVDRITEQYSVYGSIAPHLQNVMEIQVQFELLIILNMPTPPRSHIIR